MVPLDPTARRSPATALRQALLVASLLAAPGTTLAVAAQDDDPPPAPAPTPGDDPEPEPIRPEDVVPEPALICVDRKSARGDGIGVFRREFDGRMTRVWDGEAYDALHLFDRTIWIGERWTGRVRHLDADGKTLHVLEGYDRPVDVEVLKDGTVVIVENDRNEVIGVDPATGARRWTRTGFEDPFDAAPRPGGGLLVADSGAGRVVALDAQGKEVGRVTGLGFVNTVEPLEEGGFLATNWSGGEVFRFDAEFQLVWRRRLGGTLYSAEMRPDGLIVVCDGAGARIHHLDPEGRPLTVESFEPGCVDYETILEL